MGSVPFYGPGAGPGKNGNACHEPGGFRNLHSAQQGQCKFHPPLHVAGAGAGKQSSKPEEMKRFADLSIKRKLLVVIMLTSGR